MTKLHCLEGVKFNSDKFVKLIIEGYYSRNLWIPVKVNLNTLQNDLDCQFKVIKTREKGTLMIIPTDVPDNKILVVGQVWGGFRGCASIMENHTTGNVLWSTTSSKHCKGCVAFAVLLNEGEELTVSSYGRRHDQIINFQNIDGVLKKAVYQNDEWEALNSQNEEYNEL